MVSAGHQKRRRRVPDQIKRIRREALPIPTELVYEILLRLPARSIVRFRYACELWRSITHDAYFIDTHLQLAPKAILCYSNGGYRNHQRIKILDSSWAPTASLTRHNQQGLACSSLITSCNGLLCIYSKDPTQRIQLFNPATLESLTPPPPKKSYPHYFSALHFAFHPATKEYKLIYFYGKSVARSEEAMACQVYTLGTGSWREICQLDYGPLLRRSSATVKGVMYLKFRPVGKVVSFDLKDESFTPVSLPNFELIYEKKTHQIEAFDLVELQGSVCISVPPRPYWGLMGLAMDIWMLDDEHGIKHHWTRKYSIVTSTPFPHPLLIHKEKILLLEGFKEYVLSDIKPSCSHITVNQSNAPILRFHHLESREQKEVYREDNALFYRFLVHVESLVPLRKPRISLKKNKKPRILLSLEEEKKLIGANLRKKAASKKRRN